MSDQQQDFVHLHVHTEFSLLDGLSQINRLVNRAVEMNQPALAITDHGTMFGVIDFYRACKSAGVKPIIGLEAYLARRTMYDRDPQKDNRPFHTLLLAKNKTGYQNLLKIASASQLEGYYYRPRIDREFLAEHSEGLIATSGCLAAEIPRMVEQGRDKDALELIGWYQDVFGAENFFLELQHHDIPELHALNRWLVANQPHANVPFIATNDVHYVLDTDHDPHDTLLCIQTGNVKSEQKRLRFTSQSFHLRTQAEMWSLFGEVPESLSNTLLIAEMCDVNLDADGYHLPVFPVPPGFNTETYLRYLCERGLEWRYGSRKSDPVVVDRLNHELKIIHDMGFDTYFLIVWDLCEFARHADIWWNVRGSGAGSVAAYSLGITNIDPLHNSLIFERFLNPGRETMPDVDLDYPEDRRAEMIQYCAQKYGEDKVAAIITFGTMGSKAAIRDVGRAFDMPLTEVDRIARLIPSGGKPIKFKDALGDDPEKALPELKQAYATDPSAKKIIDTAKLLEGITRHASTHAAGVIVADKPLVEYIPLHRPTKGSAEDAPVKMVTQFPMETCESIGLLKVDFLGLSTLTIMRRACELVERYHGIEYTLDNIPYRPDPDDPEKTRQVDEMFAMLGRGETIGVFQLESQGMRRMLTDMRPKIFEHIVAGISLYRPGPMEYIPQYNRRLHGDEEVEYKHAMLESILAETYGIIVYQEQIQQIGAKLFGYTLGEADLMRRAVSKKKAAALQEHRERFKDRGPDHGVDVESADAIFDDIEFFARYGFNKCLTADTRIINAASGRLVRIGDVANGAATLEQTITLDTNATQLRIGAVSAVMENGIKTVYRVTTKIGKTITATRNHPFYTREGWRELSELMPGDEIATPRCLPVEGSQSWDDDRIAAVIDDLRDPADRNKALPDDVFTLTNAELGRFLGALWPYRMFAWEDLGRVIINGNQDRTFADQMHHILLRLGITSQIVRPQVQSDNPDLVANPPYELMITGQANIMRLEHWVLDHIEHAPQREQFARMAYVGVDGNPLPPQDDVFWDEIKTIERAGEEMTYDLTVPGTHNFVANDIIVHNSHAADYAVLTCQTAFLKCHYPHEYMAALMSVQRDDSAKVSLFAADCLRMGIAVLPPTVNDSLLDFSIQDMDDGTRAIRFGMGAVKNVGVMPLEHIIDQREAGGRFADLDDLCRRVDTRLVNKRPMESLIKVGALDEFGERYVLLAAVENIISFSADHHKAKDVGQMSLFGESTGVEFGAEESILGALMDVEPVDQREMLNWEKELVGLYVTDHPLKPIMDQIQAASTHTTAELEELGEQAQDRPVAVAGLVTGLRAFPTKAGDMMAVVTLEDITGSISGVMFPRTWNTYRDIVDEDAVLIMRGKADASRGDLQIIVDSVSTDFTMVTATNELPKLDEVTFDWIDDDPVPAPIDNDASPDGQEDDEDDIYDEETGEVVATTPEDEALALNTEPVMPASAGASANVATPAIEPAKASAPPVVRDAAPAAKSSARAGYEIVDREEPAGLDEDDDRWVPVPDWADDAPQVASPPPAPPPPVESARDEAGRIKPPPAPAARPRDAADHIDTMPLGGDLSRGGGDLSRGGGARPEAAPPAPEEEPAQATPVLDAARARRRTPPPKAAPKPKPEPGRLLTIYLQRTDDSARDRRWMQRLHGILTQYPGNDQFRFVLEGSGKRAAVMAFPNHPIKINDEMLAEANDLVGKGNVEVTDPARQS